MTELDDRRRKQLELRALSATINTLKGNQLSAVDAHRQLQASLTARAQRRNVTERSERSAGTPVLLLSLGFNGQECDNAMMPVIPSLVQDNVARIQERIARAARRSGRRVEEITLVAISKTHSVDTIRAAAQAGIGHFGENRIQEWEGKHLAVQDLPATWHMVGHLQSNKAARAAGLFHTVDSVDDLALAQRLDRARSPLRLPVKLRILLEVRSAEEQTKTGVSPAELPALAQQVSILPQLELAGLMCIPPFLEDPERVRPYFRQLRELREKLATQLSLPLPILSMGMSHDFEAAIEEGASEVRIGTAIFGERTR